MAAEADCQCKQDAVHAAGGLLLPENRPRIIVAGFIHACRVATNFMRRTPGLQPMTGEPGQGIGVIMRMRITIRPMAIDDYDQVVALWRCTDGVGLNESDTREGVDAYLQRYPGLSLLACDGREIIGAVLCGHDGRRGYLHHLAVAPSHRRKGIGKQLVDRCLLALADCGIAKCNIMVYADNDHATAFWERGGWLARTDLAVRQRVTAPPAVDTC